MLLLAHDIIFLLLLAHDIIQRGSIIILERSIITQTIIVGGENVLSINRYDSSHCIIQRKYYFSIKYYYSKKYYFSNKCYYSNKYYENKKSIIKSEKYFCCFWRAINKHDLVEFKVHCLKVFCYHGNKSTILLFY